MTSRRHFLGLLAATGVGAASHPRRLLAQANYPNRPIHIIVPFAPGGGADLVSRLIAPHLQETLGEPGVVENRSGAAGRLGTGVVAKSAPDGYTLLVTTESSLVIAPHIGIPIGYDPLKDFEPISLLTRNTVMLAVNPATPVHTLEDYIALARKKPGGVFFASSGVGGPNHLAGEIFNRMVGVKITHVPYQGTGLALQAVVSGQVGSMWGFMAGLIPYIRDGKLRAIAVGSKERSAVLPEVPTVAESGVPGYEAVSWIGMMAPADTPQPVVDKLSAAIPKIMRSPAVSGVLIKSGAEVVAGTPAEFAAVINSDYAKYGKLSDVFKTN